MPVYQVVIDSARTDRLILLLLCRGIAVLTQNQSITFALLLFWRLLLLDVALDRECNAHESCRGNWAATGCIYRARTS